MIFWFFFIGNQGAATKKDEREYVIETKEGDNETITWSEPQEDWITETTTRRNQKETKRTRRYKYFLYPPQSENKFALLMKKQEKY